MAEASPYRHSEVRSTCVSCQEEGQVTCRRCGRSFCELHGPQTGARCSWCLDVYEERKRGIRYWPWIIGAELPVLTFWLWWGPQLRLASSRVWLPLFDALIAILGTSLIIVGPIVGLRVLASRILFLQERPPRELSATGAIARTEDEKQV
jgi:hypothetical protein